MAKFIFIGDQRDLKDKEGNSLRGHGPDTITAQGVTFRKGEVSGEVSEAVAKKLRGNSHFREVAEEVSEVNDDPNVYPVAVIDNVPVYEVDQLPPLMTASNPAHTNALDVGNATEGGEQVLTTSDDPFPLSDEQPQG